MNGANRGSLFVRSFVAGAMAVTALAGSPRAGVAQTVTPAVVYVAPIEGMIDMGLVPFVQRVLDEAQANNASAVVFEINTFGGRLDAAVAIRDALLSASVRTIAFVNRRAISAGALITLASMHVVMGDGGTIGAATPVQLGQPGAGAAPVEEKTVSYVRKEFRATADHRKRRADIAEAMVDADVEIPGLVEKGKLLTLTTSEALQHGIADHRAENLDQALAHYGLAGAERRHLRPNWGEGFVRLITQPIVASLLLSVAMLGILIELRTPGFGVAGALGLSSLVLLLGGHWIVQLVGWEELLLVGIGAALLILEVAVLPGFGLAGVLGGVAILAGLAMSLVGHGATLRAVTGAVARIGLAAGAALVASLVLLRYLPKMPIGRRLILETGLPSGGGGGRPAEQDPSLLGRTGRAMSPLRPAGIADLDGERVDVVSDGDMIEVGAPIVVTRVDGNRIVVRRQRTKENSTEKSQ